MTPTTPQIEYYQTLQVAPSATMDEIRQAYRKRAKACHPDCGGRHEDMVAICEAAEILLNPETRALYDRWRAANITPTEIVLWQKAEYSAHVCAANYPDAWEDFQRWMDARAQHVQKTWQGRMAAGAVAGAIVGAAFGLVVGPWIGVGMVGGVCVGLLTGLLVGIGVGATKTS